MRRKNPGAWQSGGSVTPPDEDEREVHPLGPITPVGEETPDFATTGATNMDESVEDESMVNMRTDTPILPELIPPQQSFHSTELEEREQDPREISPLSSLPLTTEQQDILAVKSDEETDIFKQEKWTVPVIQEPSERWSIEQFNLPAADGLPVRVADRQERRIYALIINTTGGATISVGTTSANVVPLLTTVGIAAGLKLTTLAPIYAQASVTSTIAVIQEFTE